MFSPERKMIRRAENVDIVIGFLGFFAAVLVVVTVVTELHGASAVGWSLLLLLDVLAIWGLWRLRRRLPEPEIHRKLY